MKKLFIFLCAALLASCTTYEHKPTRIVPYTIEFNGPENALHPWMSAKDHTKFDGDGQPGQGEVTYAGVFPLTHAIACNAEKTSCKHALIQTDLTYQIHEVNSVVEFTGNLKSKMGRSITRRVEAQPGSYTDEARSLGDDVEIIGTTAVDTPFSFIYSPGKRVVLEGLEGVKVIITFSAAVVPAA